MVAVEEKTTISSDSGG